MCVNKHYQETKTYLTHEETGGSRAKSAEANSFGTFAQSFVQRKLCVKHKTKKRHENQSPAAQTNEQLSPPHANPQYVEGHRPQLERISHREKNNGSWSIADPYQWPSLNLAMDRGSDCCCIDHYLTYNGYNSNTDYDPSHDATSVGRNTLKIVNLWTHQVIPPPPHTHCNTRTHSKLIASDNLYTIPRTV